jgi:NADH-quinone oxidoreductase subunit G
MKVSTQLPEVTEAHKWALEFHLINHPLDCPICDQAGECELQNSYMDVGKYQSQMTRPKVLKPKALDVGGDLVLDTERCILCSRCVRFEDDVTKSKALGIFDRGDRAIIGTYPEKKISHNYTANLVDICPVGAFTSKDFRFKQRVWFLKEKPSICPGCSTGCAVEVHGKPETGHYYRMKPRYSEVNDHWMCDKGRHVYMHLNPEVRLQSAVIAEGGTRRNVPMTDGLSHLAQQLAGVSGSDIGLLISAQYTVEEYKSVFDLFVKTLGVKQVYQWRETTEKTEEFDGLLWRGDQNANTFGLLKTMKEYGLSADRKNQFDEAVKSKSKVLLAFAPEIPETFPSLSAQLQELAKHSHAVLLTTHASAAKIPGFKMALPLKGFAEKTGTFMNYQGVARPLTAPYKSAILQARDLTEVCKFLGTLLNNQRTGTH